LATSRIIAIFILGSSVQEQLQPRRDSTNTGCVIIDHYTFLVSFSFQNAEYKNVKNNIVDRYYGTLLLILKGEHKSGVSESKSLRKIFGPKRDSECEKFTIVPVHNEEFCDVYRSSSVGRVRNVRGYDNQGV
jgi:hypothetical protein